MRKALAFVFGWLLRPTNYSGKWLGYLFIGCLTLPTASLLSSELLYDRSPWGAFLGLAVGLAIFLLLAAVCAEIDQYDEKLAGKSLSGWLTLCRHYRKVTVSRTDAINAGLCNQGVNRFADRYFPGRESVTVAELMPFMGCNHEDWTFVMIAVAHRLQTIGVLSKAGQLYSDRAWIHYIPGSYLSVGELQRTLGITTTS